MNFKKARAYVKKSSKYGIVPGLDNITELCRMLRNPQNELDVIHIAGTNGKGSVGAFAESILIEAGKKTGRFLSPAVFDYLEQFKINGENMTETDYAYYMSRVCECADKMEIHPTPFELETAMAFLYFKDKGCDVVLLEVGMGGREDATNVIEKSLVSVITPISIDHTSFLGNSLEEIAYQKAGIIKENGLAAVAPQSEIAMRVIEEECDKKNASLIKIDGTTDYEISLDGEYQRENALLAESVCRFINGVSEEHIRKGLKNTVWNGRFEKICDNPIFITDGTHNADGARRLTESVEKYYGDKKKIYIMGVFADKDYDEIARITTPFADKIYTITPDNPRALSGKCLAETVSKYNKNVEAVTLDTALRQSLDKTDCAVFAFGSLSFLGDLKKQVGNIIKMKKCGKILKNEKFKKTLSQIKNMEKDRIYCGHGIEHLTEVARGAYILSLENGLDIPKELIYAAAFLHDIGRYEQYKTGIEHHEAGEKIADEILAECGFSDLEREMIRNTVMRHRETPQYIKNLGDVIAIADKKTRQCMFCEAYDTCKWSENEKNKEILF